MDTLLPPDSERGPLIRRTFCIPAETVQKMQDAAIANGWCLGHMVERAFENYLDLIGGPYPPSTARLPRGRRPKNAGSLA